LDVIVGNPPWKSLTESKLKPEDKKTWHWLSQNEKKKDTPVAGHQVAQAFVWESREYLKPGGEAALLLPAMTLFEDRSRHFRSTFFRRNRVHSVANFSNLAEVLFAGRSRVPAAAFFFHPVGEDDQSNVDQFIETFSPLVANQELTRPTTENTRERVGAW